MVAKRILLVEGKDDEHVIKALLGRRQLPHLDIRQHEGVDRLLEALPVRIKESGIQSLGVVVDADSDVNLRWIAIRDRLISAGYEQVPEFPEPNGLILSPLQGSILPKLGVWIMPNNEVNGILEDFIRFLIPVNDVLFEHAERAVAGLPSPLKFLSAARSKALIYTWLAWQEEPGRPLGQSITAQFLDDNCTEAEVFVAWLRHVFFS